MLDGTANRYSTNLAVIKQRQSEWMSSPSGEDQLVLRHEPGSGPAQSERPELEVPTASTARPASESQAQAAAWVVSCGPVGSRSASL
jgi:hypothetical protein